MAASSLEGGRVHGKVVFVNRDNSLSCIAGEVRSSSVGGTYCSAFSRPNCLNYCQVVHIRDAMTSRIAVDAAFFVRSTVGLLI